MIPFIRYELRVFQLRVKSPDGLKGVVGAFFIRNCGIGTFIVVGDNPGLTVGFIYFSWVFTKKLVR